MKKVIRLDEGKKVELHILGEAKGYSRILINKELTGAKNFALQVAEIFSNGVSKTHSHDVEHGFFILSGQGVITIDEENYPVARDMAIYVPAGVNHTIKNVSTEPLRYIVIYAPSI
ncbi:cupin domain-containing protein [Candidatus Bathyarchaeota archaeon]|nr:cupin domain-containing protein [Candidatus Bathyarchaeota archaeon]